MGPRALAVLTFVLASVPHGATAERGCPPDMVALGTFCIDAHEAFLEALDDGGAVKGVFPHFESPAKRQVRAASRAGEVPQAYVTQREAAAACGAAGKRLCTDEEWLTACRGEPATRYPYGTERRAGYCNDAGREPLPAVFGRSVAYTLRQMNDPRLDRVPGTVARAGAFPACRSAAPIFDLVGNLHEWTADAGGTMRGGYFLDTESLGRGCDYVAVGHDADYADYSTGFRCCADR